MGMKDPRGLIALAPLGVGGRVLVDRDMLASTGKDAPADVGIGEAGGTVPEHIVTGDYAPSATVLTRYLPQEFPIPGATEFQRDTFLTSPGAGSITPGALTFRIPTGSYGIIRSFGVGLNLMTAATDVVFSIRVDGRPVPAWGTLRMFPGAASRVTTQVPTWIELEPSAIITVVITNVDGAVYVLGVNYSGWYWGVAADQAWRGHRGEVVA